jgi:DHA1 family bicyclomycin/chloramphenicol resistance-like MFS transporter
MGAVVMAGRAIVRDLYPPEQGARVLSKALSGLGVIAAFSAPVGGWVASNWGWRAALGVPAVYGVLSLALLARRFKETVTQPNPHALRPAVLWRTWQGIVSNPVFWTYSLLATATYAGLFTFLGASSFVFIDVLGVSRVAYGWTLFTMACSYLAGTFLCRHLLPRMGVRRTVWLGGFISLGSASVLALLPHLGLTHPLGILLPYCVFMVGHGIHQPCGQSGAVGPFPHAAGAASALSGMLMMLAAFAMGSWLGWRMDGTVYPLTHGIWFWAVCIAFIVWVLVPRYGSPPHAEGR